MKAPRAHGWQVKPSRTLPLLAAAATLLAAPASAEVRLPDEPARIAVAGDAQEEGGRPALRAAVAQMERLDVALLLYGGDTSYGWGGPPDDWADALGPYEDRTLLVPGNHDDAEAYASWRTEDANATWWSAEAGVVVIVALDSDQPAWPGTPQWEWLERTLREHRDDTVVLATHVPWWVPNAHHSEELAFPGDARRIDALVREHDVDLVLGAHEHYYARIDRDGVPHVVNSAVEAQLRDVPREVEEEAARSGKVSTWILLDVLPCGVAGRTYHVEDGGVLDRFHAQGDDREAGRLVVEKDAARCVVEKRPPTPDDDASNAGGDGGPEESGEDDATRRETPAATAAQAAALAGAAALAAARRRPPRRREPPPQ